MPPHVYWISLLFFLSLFGYIVWVWRTRLKSSDEAGPKWKSVTSIAGLCFATVSTGLAEFLYIHAAFTGGDPFYHPIELFCIRFGMLTAVLGFPLACAVGQITRSSEIRLLGCDAGTRKSRCFSEYRRPRRIPCARTALYSSMQPKFKASSVPPEPLYFAT